LSAWRPSIRIDWKEPGLLVSVGLHGLALAAGLVTLSSPPAFDMAEEAIAVEVVSESQLAQMTRGERSAPAVVPNAKPRAERVAEVAVEKPPSEDKRDAPAPPQRPADMAVDDKPVQVAAPPPPPPPARPPEARPEPKPEAKPQPTVDPRREQMARLAEEAELKAKAEAKAEAEAREERARVEKTRAEAAAKAKAEAEAKARREAEQKLAEARREAEEKAKAEKARVEAAAKAKAEAEAKARREAELAAKFNAGDIAKLLQSKEAAQSSGAAAREVNRTASLGTAAGNAAKLNPSMRGQLIGLLRDQMERCYSPPVGSSAGATTLPVIDLRLNPDGTLAGEPRVMRAGASAVDNAVAQAALRAVRRCAPYRVPAQFAPYFHEWQQLNVEFETAAL
jgi:colicin import membrane protein